MALVTVAVGPSTPVPPGLEDLVHAFRAAGRPVVHATTGEIAHPLLTAASPDLDDELLAAGGVQTLGFSEMAIRIVVAGAFDATPLDALLRSLGIDTVVVGGAVPSDALTATVRDAELRGFRVLLATEELAVTLSPQLIPA